MFHPVTLGTCSIVVGNFVNSSGKCVIILVFGYFPLLHDVIKSFTSILKLTYGVSLDDPNTIGIQIHCMIKLGLNIDEDPIVADEEVDMPTLEDDVDEGSCMEEVD